MAERWNFQFPVRSALTNCRSSSTILMYLSQKLKNFGLLSAFRFEPLKQCYERIDTILRCFPGIINEAILPHCIPTLSALVSNTLFDSVIHTNFSQSRKAFHNGLKSTFMVSLWARIPLLYDFPSIKTEAVPAAQTPDSISKSSKPDCAYCFPSRERKLRAMWNPPFWSVFLNSSSFQTFSLLNRLLQKIHQNYVSDRVF